ncbi:MAG: iron ABC transporter permease [Bacteroidales bacterium]|nr:iron ABC transporter permease [Bacteroidales bacterium]
MTAILLSLTTGEIDVSVFELPEYLGKQGGSVVYSIMNKIRLPRVLLGLAVGGALSLSGVILQGIYRNPLVEPYTLGISGGGALGVALVIVFGLHRAIGSFMLPLAGFIGALVTIVLVYSLSLRNGKIHIQSMLLIGVMISFIVSSAMMLLMALTTAENLHGIIFWIMGSLDEPNFTLIRVTLLVSLAGLVIAYLFVQPLNALRLGETKAKHLGVNTEVSIRMLFILASLMTGMCVAVAGVIGFVGLIIPHLMRLMVGTDYRVLLLCSFLGGSAFIIFSDLIARTIISPNELPIGVITGIIGGTVFVVVLSRSNMKFS